VPSEIFAPGLLDGRVVLITGGGTNLGKGAAIELARCGAHVVIAGRREEVLAEAVEEIGPLGSFVAGDIREPEQAARIVQTVLERHGRLDVLIGSAGGQYFVPAEDIVAKGWGAVMGLNIGGTLTMIEAVVPVISNGGAIVTVTVSPHHGMPAMAHTGAARAAVEAIGVDYAARLADRDVAVVNAAIGRFDTESLRKYPPNIFEGAARTVPLQRLGSLDEFAWLMVLLATPMAHALSGSTVTLDGGADNWFGPWPPEVITDDAGDVPTEQRAGAPER
jgi:citronellol/citronellal dehydrogenase